MGGKALNQYGIFTERKNTEEFSKIGLEIKNRLFHDLGIFSSIVKCYYMKPDHGDLDLLICIDQEFINKKIDLIRYIREVFKPQAIHNNANVCSFDYNKFQIDFIKINQKFWEIANIYYSFDAQGNIVGKTFHKFNLSYGWDGLRYKYRNSTGRNIKTIEISTDARKIYEFGGYDYDRFLLGFETLEDIFKFVIAGKYFDSEMFKFENLKYIDRKRNRKRESYHMFLDYLNDNNINIKYNFHKNKDEYLSLIDSTFPEAKLLEQLSVLKEEDRLNQIRSQKFNGDMVMLWLPNLQGKELGAAITKFKTVLGYDYDGFILDSNYETIHNTFMKIYNE